MADLQSIGAPSPVTARQRAELAAPDALPGDGVDCSDGPDALDWSNARGGGFYADAGRDGGERCPDAAQTGALLGSCATPAPAVVAELNPVDRGLRARRRWESTR